jgi:hypothetical protein
MGRTERSDLHRWDTHESKAQRHTWLKRQRAAARRAIRRGRYELAERDQRKTRGWLTW